MRRAAALILVLGLLAGGCTSPKPTIGFLLGGLENERYYKDLASFRDSVVELGGTVAYKAANHDPARQVSLARSLIEQGASVLVVQPLDGPSGDQIMALSKTTGVPVVGYDRLYRGSTFSPMLVTQDSFRVGQLQAEYAARALGGKGRVLIVRGLEGHLVADEMTRGNLEELARHPGLTVLPVVQSLEWDVGSGYRYATGALAQHPDVNAILCNNSSLARGAIKALREAGLAGRVYVAGADADLENCQEIVRGNQGMEVLKEIAPLARAAAEVSMALARGETPAWQETFRYGDLDVQIIRTPVQALDRESLDRVVIDTGFHPRAAVYLEETP